MVETHDQVDFQRKTRPFRFHGVGNVLDMLWEKGYSPEGAILYLQVHYAAALRRARKPVRGMVVPRQRILTADAARNYLAKVLRTGLINLERRRMTPEARILIKQTWAQIKRP